MKADQILVICPVFFNWYFTIKHFCVKVKLQIMYRTYEKTGFEKIARPQASQVFYLSETISTILAGDWAGE